MPVAQKRWLRAFVYTKQERVSVATHTQRSDVMVKAEQRYATQKTQQVFVSSRPSPTTINATK